MTRPRRVLLVTHELSRTGAPRIALLVARSLGRRGARVSVVSRRPGPLEPEFAQAARTRLEPFLRVRRRLGLVSALAPVARAVDTASAVATLLRHRPDLVYLNSTASVAYLRACLLLRRRVVLHSHESTEVAERFIGPSRARALLRHARLVACSPSVQTSLAELAGVPVDEVVMLPSVPDGPAVEAAADLPPDVSYRPDEIVVGCCGSVEHRKGTDLWLEVAERVRAAHPQLPLRFVWVGEIVDPELTGRASDAAPPRTPWAEVFVGPSANPYAHMRRFNIATLPSRDDPFPLVVLESMLLGTPVVAFAVGGVPEQIGDAGIVVPPLDVAAFADAVGALVADADLRSDLGRRARERARTRFSVEAFAELLDEVVEEP